MTITLDAAVERSFVFPAALPEAWAYYGDFGHIIHYLPHIRPVKQFRADCYRLLYQTRELKAYDVRIFADVTPVLHDEKQLLHVRQARCTRPVSPRFKMFALRAQGNYESYSTFTAAGEGETHVHYRLELKARLPTPGGLRVIPGRVMNRIADNITRWRMHEIADGFVERTIAAYPAWQAAR